MGGQAAERALWSQGAIASWVSQLRALTATRRWSAFCVDDLHLSLSAGRFWSSAECCVEWYAGGYMDAAAERVCYACCWVVLDDWSNSRADSKYSLSQKKLCILMVARSDRESSSVRLGGDGKSTSSNVSARTYTSAQDRISHRHRLPRKRTHHLPHPNRNLRARPPHPPRKAHAKHDAKLGIPLQIRTNFPHHKRNPLAMSRKARENAPPRTNPPAHVTVYIRRLRYAPSLPPFHNH